MSASNFQTIIQPQVAVISNETKITGNIPVKNDKTLVKGGCSDGYGNSCDGLCSSICCCDSFCGCWCD